jgi:hypothetical protein
MAHKTHPDDLDLALSRHGLPSGNVGRLLQSAATILAAWEQSASDEDWAAWSRTDGPEAMAELEAALETFAPEEGE